jgi:hypothetical protein
MRDAERAERVDDGVHDGGECPGVAGLAGASLTSNGLVLVGTRELKREQPSLGESPRQGVSGETHTGPDVAPQGSGLTAMLVE